MRALTIGGASIAVSGRPARRWITERLARPFFRPGGPPVLTLTTARLSAPPPPARVTFESGRGWSVGETPSSWLISFLDDHRASSPTLYQYVALDRAWRSGTLYLPRSIAAGDTRPFFLGYPLEHILVTSLLAHSWGVVVHAAGVGRDDRGWVFAGTHGAGKSTIARMFVGRAESAVLNDDRVVVRHVEGRWRVFGTPWAGTVMAVSPGSSPLAGILFLRHGTTTRPARLSAGEAAARLLPRCFHPYWDRAGIEGLLATVARAVDEVPCYDFPFVPEAGSVVSALSALAT